MFEGESPKSVFEIGCGGSALLKEVSDKFGGLRVGGLDSSSVRMKNTKNVFPEVKFLLHDLNDPIPLEDNSFDIVFSVCVLGYILNPEPVIKEMLRVCRDKIILAEYHEDKLDEHGGFLIAKMPDRNEVLIRRNYIRLFSKLGRDIILEDGGQSGKAIIKCQKFQS